MKELQLDQRHHVLPLQLPPDGPQGQVQTLNPASLPCRIGLAGHEGLVRGEVLPPSTGCAELLMASISLSLLPRSSLVSLGHAFTPQKSL